MGSEGEDESSLLPVRAVAGDGCQTMVRRRQCAFTASEGLNCKRHQGAAPHEMYCLVAPAGASRGDFPQSAWPHRGPAITPDTFSKCGIPLYTRSRVQLQGDGALQLVNCYVDGTGEDTRGNPEYAMLREGCVCFVTLASLDARNTP